jgi:hypothetical protein
LSHKVEEAKKVNKIEEEKFRKLAQMNAALKAKLEFIQSKYDFTTNVNHLNSDDFKTLMTTNDLVSLSIDTLTLFHHRSIIRWVTSWADSRESRRRFRNTRHKKITSEHFI